VILAVRLTLEDDEVVGRTWSRLAHMLAIMRLAWQETAGHRWSSSVISGLSRNRDGTGARSGLQFWHL